MIELLSNVWDWILHALWIVFAWAFVLIIIGGSFYALYIYIRPEHSIGGKLDGIRHELEKINEKKEKENKQ